jgi:hypothetical protein
MSEDRMNATVEKPAVTRMWVALQKLNRLRDGFSRDTSPDGRLSTARAMIDLADEVRSLSAELLIQAEQGAASPAPVPG